MAPLPTRILDVRDYPTSLRLVISNGRRAKYVALSHCWGGKLHLRTTKDTLEKHQKYIPCSGLSETIRNAAWVTKDLGIDYLWIDSLCIIQEDVADFHRESRQMSSVYQNSYLTIAATGAIDGTQGLFLRSTQAGYIAALCNAEEPEQGHMYFNTSFSPAESIFEAPLNKRAWVLQEHLFARRTLHFASNQLYWECRRIFVGEDEKSVDLEAFVDFPCRNFLLNSLERAFEKPGYDPFRIVTWAGRADRFKGVYTMWARIIQYYSGRGLTNPSDKLPAILSLSLELERLLGPSFRMHEGHLFGGGYRELQSLLWWAHLDARLCRPAQRRAPSWSWASVDGAVGFVDVHSRKRFSISWDYPWYKSDKDLEVLEVKTYPTPGMPDCKALLLNGTILECFASRPEAADSGVSQYGYKLDNVYTKNGDVIESDLEYDVADDRLGRFWIILVYVRLGSRRASRTRYFCLMVKRANNHCSEARVFERLGAGIVFDTDRFDKCERESLVLI